MEIEKSLWENQNEAMVGDIYYEINTLEEFDKTEKSRDEAVSIYNGGLFTIICC